MNTKKEREGQEIKWKNEIKEGRKRVKEEENSDKGEETGEIDDKCKIR